MTFPRPLPNIIIKPITPIEEDSDDAIRSASILGVWPVNIAPITMLIMITTRGPLPMNIRTMYKTNGSNANKDGDVIIAFDPTGSPPIFPISALLDTTFSFSALFISVPLRSPFAKVALGIYYL